jgi:hypothetical protein
MGLSWQQGPLGNAPVVRQTSRHLVVKDGERLIARVANHVSFEADEIDVYLDGKQLALEPGQSVIAHGVDRGLDPDEIRHHGNIPVRA